MSTAAPGSRKLDDHNSQVHARPAGPCTMVIFGATGDLTARKLIPSLYNLYQSKLLPQEFAVVGVAYDGQDTDAFRELVSKHLEDFAGEPIDAAARDWLLQRIYFLKGDFKDPNLYQNLETTLNEVDERHNTGKNHFFYLATSPAFFCDITEQLGHRDMLKENGSFRRAVYEKPFGHDLESAIKLNRDLLRFLSEKQIYRIDHYLGKETVQNLLVFRFGNGIFEPVWNRRFIDHVQITVAETVGVEKRGKYFDSAGTLRDMVPNHISQLISLVSMEPPNSFGADEVRDEQSKVLRAVQPLTAEDVLQRTVRGQYGEGEIDGQGVAGYREEPDVPPNSNTETFVALKLTIDNWRWAGVPFYARTGKRMGSRHTEIAIQFKEAPFVLFRNTAIHQLKPNFLVVHIAPDEGISMRFSAKIPGPQMRLGNVDMNFNYTDYFGEVPNTGYEVLIYDCMIGDQTLFQRADQVEAGWSIVNPILDVWQALPARSFPNYPAGSWGPKESSQLLERDGRAWRDEAR
ncbi:MAG: glucose-6-phosphate dehydrogenase [Acidobacteriales bacterium]|nr:glucose-6-phosphate dehydrogenase [Terriglobales bacterium]